MKLAAVYCVYNEEEYIECSIRSVYDAVDHVFVLLGRSPFRAYNARAREQFQQADQTEAIVLRLAATHPKIRLVTGVWDSEQAQRNAGMRLCLAAGCTYYFLVDGDEVYRSDHLEHLREEIAAHPEAGQFIIKCHLFWRSFRYRFPAEDLGWMPRRVFKVTWISRLGKSWIPLPWPCWFTGGNKTNSWGTVYHIPPERVVFYHFSYARRPEKMREKLMTFSHAHQILAGWYERVWLRWPQQRDMTSIHPIDPPKFARAVARDVSDLPEVMRSHPYFTQEIIA